jgi:hypothetical protein
MQNQSVDTATGKTVAMRKLAMSVNANPSVLALLDKGMTVSGSVVVEGDDIIIVTVPDDDYDARIILKDPDTIFSVAFVREGYAEQDKADLFTEYAERKKAANRRRRQKPQPQPRDLPPIFTGCNRN